MPDRVGRVTSIVFATPPATAGVANAAAGGAATVGAVGRAARSSVAAAAGAAVATGRGGSATGRGTAVGSSTATALSPLSAGHAVGSSTAAWFSAGSVANAAGVASVAAVSSVQGFDAQAVAVDTVIASHGLTITDGGIATDHLAERIVLVSSAVASDVVILREIRKAVGRAAGVADASFQTDLAESQSSTGVAVAELAATWRATEVSTAAATNELEVVQRSRIVGAAAGASTAAATAIGGTNGVGTAAGSAVVLATGLGPTVTTGTAAGVAAVSGVIAAVFEAVGSSYGTSSAAGVSHGHYLETLESVGVAEATLQFPAPEVYPVFWSNTIGAAGATWEGLPFNSMIEVDGRIYAAGVGGLYLMEDQADDDGEAVLANIQWDLTDLGSDYKQRSRSIYVSAVAAGPFTVRVGNKQGEFEHETHLPFSTKAVNHRAPLGRGMSSRAIRINLLQRHYFSAGDVNIGIGDTTRRV